MKRFREFITTSVWVFKLYWRISPFLLLTILITQVFLQLQTIVYAYIFGLALDKVILLIQIKSTSSASILPLLFLFLSIYLVFNLASLINNRASNILSYKDTWFMKKFLYEHMVKLGLVTLEDPELTNKATRFQETTAFVSQHLQLVIGLIAMIVTLITTGVIVSVAVPILTPIFIFFFILKFTVNQKYIGLIWKFNRESTEERRKATSNAWMLTEPSSLKEIILTGSVSFISKKFVDFVLGQSNEFTKINLNWFKFELLQTFLDTGIYALGLYLVITKGIVGGITIGTISFLIRSVSTFYDQLDTLSYRIARARDSAIRIKDSQELFEGYDSDSDGDLQVEKDDKPSGIKLENISFAYPKSSKNIFTNLNLEIKPGERIAIVGENGAGKTTLVKIISRLYRVDRGEVLIDGQNINKFKIETWHNKIGVLFQDFNSYGQFTVSENVGIGKIEDNGFDINKVKKALADADAMEFVKKYPNKLDQVLSERYKGGTRPSTGQWQKIAIARFFYRNAPVLILDEPTASIDAVAEAQIFDNIYKFIENKTVIIISHRFSTVRNADRIIVLDKGEIVEQGSHDELLKKNGKYAKAFKLQAKGYK